MGANFIRQTANHRKTKTQYMYLCLSLSAVVIEKVSKNYSDLERHIIYLFSYNEIKSHFLNWSEPCRLCTYIEVNFETSLLHFMLLMHFGFVETPSRNTVKSHILDKKVLKCFRYVLLKFIPIKTVSSL